MERRGAQLSPIFDLRVTLQDGPCPAFAPSGLGSSEPWEAHPGPEIARLQHPQLRVELIEPGPDTLLLIVATVAVGFGTLSDEIGAHLQLQRTNTRLAVGPLRDRVSLLRWSPDQWLRHPQPLRCGLGRTSCVRRLGRHSAGEPLLRGIRTRMCSWRRMPNEASEDPPDELSPGYAWTPRAKKGSVYQTELGAPQSLLERD